MHQVARCATRFSHYTLAHFAPRSSPQDAALALRVDDYTRLPTAARLALLRALADLALASETLREHIATRLENYSSNQPRTTYRFSAQHAMFAAQHRQLLGGGDDDGEVHYPEEWALWMEVHRCVACSCTSNPCLDQSAGRAGRIATPSPLCLPFSASCIAHTPSHTHAPSQAGHPQAAGH